MLGEAAALASISTGDRKANHESTRQDEQDETGWFFAFILFHPVHPVSC
jgi:hypothetical protein